VKKRVISIGNSFGIVLDRAILALLDVAPGAELSLTIVGQRLILEPVRHGSKRRAIQRSTKRRRLA
jgi:antitoxin component of MazEF toxin-antitoxin module